jgi:hypothetical protein
MNSSSDLPIPVKTILTRIRSDEKEDNDSESYLSAKHMSDNKPVVPNIVFGGYVGLGFLSVCMDSAFTKPFGFLIGMVLATALHVVYYCVMFSLPSLC